MSFEEYKTEVEEKFDKCTILHSTKDHYEKNCGGTGDRTAYKGISWIDYWRAMTGNHSNTMLCSSCGKEIFVGNPSALQNLAFTQGNDTVEKHRAHGGHIWINTPADKSYPGGRYITPLCPDCNGQHDKNILIKKDAVYCKELGATKDKD